MLEEFEYTCAPKTNIKRASLLTVVCLVTGAIIYCFSFEQTVLSPWFRVIGAVFFMAAVLLTVRFFGTRYVYRLVVDHRGAATFTVYEIRGYFGKESNVRGSGAVCRVDTLDILSLVSSVDKKGIRELKKRSAKEKTQMYNYCAADFVGEYTLIKVKDGDGCFLAKLSLDEKMKELIKNHCSFENSVIQ